MIKGDQSESTVLDEIRARVCWRILHGYYDGKPDDNQQARCIAAVCRLDR